MNNREPHVLYEVPIRGLALELATGQRLDVSATLTNGRANYVLFQHVVARCTGLSENSEGAAADLVDDAGRGYEVKSYKDPEAYPFKDERFHTAASSTFPANNRGPRGASSAAGRRLRCRAQHLPPDGLRQERLLRLRQHRGVSRQACRSATASCRRARSWASWTPDDPRLVRRRAVLDTCTRTMVVSIPARSGDG